MTRAYPAASDQPLTSEHDALCAIRDELRELRAEVTRLREQHVGGPVRGYRALSEVLGVPVRTLQRRVATLPAKLKPPSVGKGTRVHIVFATANDARAWWGRVMGPEPRVRRRQRVPPLRPPGV